MDVKIVGECLRLNVARKNKCNICTVEEQEGMLRESKEDGLIYCECCISDLAEDQMRDWILRNFKNVKK